MASCITLLAKKAPAPFDRQPGHLERLHEMVRTGQPASAQAVKKFAPRPTFVVTLQAAPGRDPIRAIRRLLKFALRQCGLRAVAAREVTPVGFSGGAR